MATTAVRRYGWLEDAPDPRDRRYAPAFATGTLGAAALPLPTRVDLRLSSAGIPIYDQGSLGSCTSNAACFLFQYVETAQRNSVVFPPSRLFLYYNIRAAKGQIDQDTGATCRDSLKSATATGLCSEGLWPYVVDDFRDKPTQQCYDEATKSKVLGYTSVAGDLYSLKCALFENHPVMFGLRIYSSFDGIGSSGLMPIPNTETEKYQGGHCVCLVGYDDTIMFGGGIVGGFVVRNSWGDSWGAGGYFFMPYVVATNSGIARDYWFINNVTNPPTVVNPPVPVNCCAKCCVIC